MLIQVVEFQSFRNFGNQSKSSPFSFESQIGRFWKFINPVNSHDVGLVVVTSYHSFLRNCHSNRLRFRSSSNGFGINQDQDQKAKISTHKISGRPLLLCCTKNLLLLRHLRHTFSLEQCRLLRLSMISVLIAAPSAVRLRKRKRRSRRLSTMLTKRISWSRSNKTRRERNTVMKAQRPQQENLSSSNVTLFRPFRSRFHPCLRFRKDAAFRNRPRSCPNRILNLRTRKWSARFVDRNDSSTAPVPCTCPEKPHTVCPSSLPKRLPTRPLRSSWHPTSASRRLLWKTTSANPRQRNVLRDAVLDERLRLRLLDGFVAVRKQKTSSHANSSCRRQKEETINFAKKTNFQQRRKTPPAPPVEQFCWATPNTMITSIIVGRNGN